MSEVYPKPIDKEKILAEVIKDDTWMVVDFVDFLTERGDDEVPKLEFYIEQVKTDPSFKLSPFQLMEILKYSKQMEDKLQSIKDTKEEINNYVTDRIKQQ